MSQDRRCVRINSPSVSPTENNHKLHMQPAVEYFDETVKDQETVALEGRLTIEKYVEWTFTEFQYVNWSDSGERNSVRPANRNNSGWEKGLAFNFSVLEKSPKLLENFFNWSNLMQKRVNEHVSLRVPGETIGAVEMLIQRLSKEHPQEQDWMRLTYDQLLTPILKDYPRKMSLETRSKIDEFLRLQNKSEQFRLKETHSINAVAIFAARILHGEARLNAALDCWFKTFEVRPLYEFIALIDNWEELKDFPIDWSLSLIRSKDIKDLPW